MNNKDTFCEHPLKGTDGDFKAATKKLITNLTSALENRFSDTTRGIFQATHIAKISSWPNAKEVQELESTVTHFLFFLFHCLHYFFSNLSVVHLIKFITWLLLWYYIKDFGDQELQVIMEHYGDVLQSAGVALDEVDSEWTALKTAVYSEQ